MAVGRVKCLVPYASFSLNTEYDIVQLAMESSTVVAMVFNDVGDLVITNDLNGASWQIVELYTSTKVV